MVPYYAYITLSVGIPISGLVIFGLLIPIVLGLFLTFLYFRKCHRLPGLIGRMIIVDFEEELEGYHRYSYYICGQKVNSFTVAAISCVCVLEFLCALIAFWNTFLTDTAIGCQDTSWDCFPLDKLNTSLLDDHQEPLNVVECANYESRDTVTILCFKFVFLYAEGLSEAGGLVFALTLGTNLYIGVFVLINRKEYWRHFFRFLVSFIGVVSFILPFTLFSFKDGRDTLRTPNRYLQFSLYMVTLFFVVFVLGFSMCLRIPRFDLEAELRRRGTRRAATHATARPSTFDAINDELGLQIDETDNAGQKKSSYVYFKSGTM